MLRYASIRSKATGSLLSNLQRQSHSVSNLSFDPSPPAIIPTNLLTIYKLFYILILTSIKLFQFLYNFQMLGFNFPPLNSVNIGDHIQKNMIIDDPLVMPHLTNILSNLETLNIKDDVIHISNVVKQTQGKIGNQRNYGNAQIAVPDLWSDRVNSNKDYSVRKYGIQSQKLQWAGVGLTKEQVLLIDSHLTEVAQQKKAKEIRFLGKILGIDRDYYILQGISGEILSLQETVKGGQKRGEGINYYSFWACNNLIQGNWTELPLITPSHIKIARKIKKHFSGHLNKPLDCYPRFDGLEKHYLKAQIVRMTYSLELAPKGVYKVNDENPKIVEFQDEPKVPEFAQLSAIQTWTHRNPNVLHLGRCTHYIDPSLPQDQIQAATAQLAQKDPQIERLRAITEDKLPEGSSFGVENIWQIKIVGNSQVFQKDEANNVYGVVLLKNLYWPGWTTIGYKSGYCNHYVGSGLKSIQATWSQYENANLGEEFEDKEQFPEPNPKDEPKPVVEEAPVEPPEQE